MLACATLTLLSLAGPNHAGSDVTSLLVPRDLASTGDAPSQPTFFRGEHSFFLYAPAEGHRVGVTVGAHQIGTYEDQVEAALIDATQAPPRTLAEGSAPPGGQIELSAGAPRRGVLSLQVRAGQNAATVAPGDQWLVVEASRERPLHVISRAGPLYFLVPPGTADFSVGVKGQGTGENVRVDVCSADGADITAAATRQGAEATAHVRVPPTPRGAICRLELGRAEEGIFEDATVWLSEEVSPYVSTRPDGLLVPFVHGLVTPPVLLAKGKSTGLQFALNVRPDNLDADRWEVALASAPGPQAVSLAEQQPVAVQTLSLELPANVPDGDYQLQARLLGGRAQVVAQGGSPLLLRQGIAYVGGWQPLVSAKLVHAGDGKAVPKLLVQRRPVPLEDGVQVKAQLQATGDPDPLVERSLDPALGGELTPARELQPGHYRWRVSVTRRDGLAPLDWDDHCFYWRGDQAFEEVRPPAPHGPLAAISDAHLERGFVAFVPEGTEAIAHNTRPTARDLGRDARVFVARGEYEPATIGVFSLRNGTEVSVTAGPLSGPSEIPAGRIDIRIARYWPQRMSWNSDTYHFIPELLERGNTVRLNAYEVGQAWLTVHVPEEAPAGVYRGEVELTSGHGEPVTKRLEVEVLPFSLVKPADMGWGLYTDSGRWNTYTEERVRAELADVVAHGYTTLLAYPLRHSQITYENGALQVDLSRFEGYMQMAIEAGLRGPWVMDLQALQGTIQNLLGRQEVVYDEEFEKVFTGICAGLRDAAEANDWGEILLHVVDEPNRRQPGSVEKAKHQLALAQSVGCRTWTTVLDLEALAEEYDPQLDVRCYSLSFIIGSADANRSRREETAASGDELQWYGSGCYTFAGGQEGHLYSNRILMGYLFAKSGATTQYTWTFQRPKADPYDDFDGEVQAQAKDACTTYRDESDTELVPTLQWEGCREGIDDARYVATLREAIEQARDRQAAAKAGAELERLLESVGWGIKPPSFTNRDAQRTRRAIADLIVGLRGAG